LKAIPSESVIISQLGDRQERRLKAMQTQTTATLTLYEQDYYLWLETIIKRLRDRHLQSVDIDNLIEELETLGRSEKKALRSHLRLIVMHLLKWRYQPDKHSKSWRITIKNNRLDVEEALQDSPSLKPQLAELLAECYPRAVIEASDETGLPAATFPSSCPFTLEQILDREFLPNP
jgi:predicted DNA-binding ribbon-helix-helix protein